MRTVATFLLTAFISAPSFAAEHCRVQDGSILRNLPKPRSQGRAGTCYAEAIATALDYHRCQKDRVANCAQSPDAISILDLIKQTLGPSTFEYGSGWNMLSELRELHQIARERCAPYTKIGDSEKRYLESNDFFSDLRAASESALKGVQFTTPQCNALSLLASHSGRPFGDLTDQLAFLTFSEFINSISVPAQCRQDSIAVQVNSSSTSTYRTDLSAAGLKALLDSKLRSGTPVVWRLCAGESHDAPCPDTDGHFAVIIGERETCCDQASATRCSREYLVRDSGHWAATYAGKGTAPGDYWLPESKIAERTAPVVASDIIEGRTIGNFMWLE